jgi:prepilin-type N-terminal cleavage/methylation domain-containing protein
MKTRSGFTIVELLIVIVVIGVLAAITIVAFNGIQNRSENSKTLAAVSQVVKLLTIYKESNGSYPTTSNYACIGTGYASDVCHYGIDGTTVQGSDQSSFNTALRTVGSLPQPSTKEYTATSNAQRVAGASFQSGANMIRYHLAGLNQPCTAGGSGPFNYDTYTQCRITLP